MKMLLALSLIYAPIMVYYSRGEAFKNSSDYHWSSITLGNLGFADSHCHTVFTGQ
jgi:hypothetical protein